MNVYVYQTSGGKDITQPLLPETKAIVLLILEQLQKDGFEFLYTKPVLKNSKPKKIKEIKRNNVRLINYKYFFFLLFNVFFFVALSCSEGFKTSHK